MIKNVIVVMLLMAGIAQVNADVVVLNDGTVIKGEFKGKTNNNVTIMSDGLPMTISIGSIKSLDIGGGGTSNAAPATVSAPAPVAAPAPAPVVQAAPVVKAAPEPASLPEVPPGTQMTIRLSQTLKTGSTPRGYKFSAVLEGSLVARGVTVLPAGTPVYGTVTQSKKSGRLFGEAEMALVVNQVNIKGRMFPIATNTVSSAGNGTGLNSLAKVATTSIIGGIANGSDGAEVGAGVGLGLALLTKGDQITLPAGTLIDFQIIYPFNVFY